MRDLHALTGIPVNDREAVQAKPIANGIDAYVVIAEPANTYGRYITTIEKYASGNVVRRDTRVFLPPLDLVSSRD